MQVPLLGSFFRDLAILQFLRSVHAQSEAGYVPIDSVSQAVPTVGNRHVRKMLRGLAEGMTSGQKFSVLLGTMSNLIPGSVHQLILVGEHSGNITHACEGACQFLQKRLEQRIQGAMGMIEPLLTIGLATCIGWVVLAMYMPMFKMFDVLDF